MKSSALGPSSILYPSSNIPLDSSTPSLATASLDSWFSLYLGFLFGNGLDLRTCWIVDSHWPSDFFTSLISHWIASSVDDLLSEFTACQGYASVIPQSSTSKTLIKQYPSEECFSYVHLSSLICYLTKPCTYIHADTRSVSLFASLDIAKFLLLFHLFAPVRLAPAFNQVPRISGIQLPSSVSTLYIDGSFLPPSGHPIFSMNAQRI
ncbi:hypothetical protein GLOIN_2v1785823 [Rhizophagus irregularis DAOM 181602=DAOM 197198]|nr:hypothetical protein GLOIN_2v1785823 [Rhizophagus irregularis DAOM 181602=DAOM 197198]